jgi:glycosyltransferase involved in cell wall biosynthesis
MKLTVSVPGSFHAFQIVDQLHRRGWDCEVHTTEFPFNVPDTAPDGRVHTYSYLQLFTEVSKRTSLPDRLLPSRWNRPLERWKATLFDRAVARNLSPSGEGIFLGFAGNALRSVERANEYGYTTAIERSSSHIATQQDILNEEYEKYGKSQPISAKHVEWERREYGEADFVVTPSKFVYETFLEHEFPADNLRCVPFGFDWSDAELDYTRSEPFRFLFAGGVTLRKGVQYLLEAWERLDLDAELLVTSGVDPGMEWLVDRYHGDDTISFLGWVNDLEAVFDRADAFVFPSLEEGSARITYEAMARGLPLVTTHNSGWVGEDGTHGIEVPIRDPAALASAIQRLYASEAERKQMGKNARELMLRDHTASDYGDRLVEAYRSFTHESY